MRSLDGSPSVSGGVVPADFLTLSVIDKVSNDDQGRSAYCSQASLVSDIPAGFNPQAWSAALPQEPTRRKIRKVEVSKKQTSKVDSKRNLKIVEKEDVRCAVGECPTISPSIHAYKAHLKQKHGISGSHKSGNPIECPVTGCGQKLQEGSMSRHILCHMDAILFECSACGARYTRVEILNTHTRSGKCPKGVTS